MLDRIKSKTQAELFLKRYKSELKGEIININSEDRLYTALNLSEAKQGDKKTEDSASGKITFKVLGKLKEKSTSYKVSIMEFDSKKMSISEINSLRSFILKGIKNGEHKFENLARVYSSHPTAKTGGGLGWTNEGTFSKRFEKAIADKRVGQVFSFDEHRENKHYVIVKTEDNKALESVNVLKIIRSK
ncbi:MAG: hypothetical protein HKP48_08900 [Winogradskyella sp.]|uniref:peptidylprolyl isomerase n=1 Tax=Winogradskyella sp. TaxID=1883156 RepID=UPI001856E776|nr:peptidylprolyl isomerase [Winogradskyella sp.]MBT8245236.1 peptidyl-prolyl cis-trans isomerase [Winogradskyella sp.]NNK23388.1 hypothetical protein [Winogradskyella sp.]